MLTILCGCTSNTDKKQMDNLAPGIYVEGTTYWIGSLKDDTSTQLREEYSLIGTVQGSYDESNKHPTQELYVTKVIDFYIGYKVYLSNANDSVSIFNEQTKKYEYFYPNQTK